MSSERWLVMAARLFPRIVKKDGVPESEIKTAEKKLGHALPAALRAIYRLSGRRRDLHAAHDRLRPPNSLIVQEGALVFYEKQDNTAAWGIKSTDLDHDDPPVVCAANLPPFEWKSDHDTVSGFLFTELLWAHVNTDPCIVSERPDSMSVEGFEKIELDGCHWDIGAIWVRGGVVVLTRNDKLYAGGSDREEFEKTVEELGLVPLRGTSGG
jgi:hypothetical protein